MATLLTLNPEKEISFPTEPTEIKEPHCVSLTLTNATTEWVAYKMKTTAPLFYLVRMSNGIIPPKGSTEVQIIQKPMTEPALYQQHRFLVQSVKSDESAAKEQSNNKEAWQKVDKSQIQEQRLGVVFQTPLSKRTPSRAPTVESQYKELLSYVEGLENKKKALLLLVDSAGRGAGSSGSFSLMQVIISVILAIAAAKLYSMYF